MLPARATGPLYPDAVVHQAVSASAVSAAAAQFLPFSLTQRLKWTFLASA